MLFALGISSLGDAFPPSALHGLKVVAVAVVAQALWGMAKTLCTDALRVSFMVTAACIVLAAPSAWSQVAVIVSAGVAGRLLFSTAQSSSDNLVPTRLNRRVGFFWFTIFVATFFLLPVLKAAIPNQLIALADAFFRAGSLVFGGGHVVLPLLQSEVVATGWISNEVFLAGYAAVVGLLLAAFYNPVWKSAIHGPKDFGLALLALVGLMFWKLPAWFVVISSGILGWVLGG